MTVVQICLDGKIQGFLSLSASQMLTYKAEAMSWYFRAPSHLNIVQFLTAWDVVLRNMGKDKDTNSRITTWFFRRKNFDLFRHLLGRGVWDTLLEVSPGELANFKGWCPLRMDNSEAHKTTQRQQETCMDEKGAPDKTLKTCISGSKVRSHSQQSRAMSKSSPPRHMCLHKNSTAQLYSHETASSYFFFVFFSCLLCCAMH